MAKDKTVHAARGKNRLFCGKKIGKTVEAEDAEFFCIPCMAGLMTRHNEYADRINDMALLIQTQRRTITRISGTLDAYEQVFTLIGTGGEPEPEPSGERGIEDVDLPSDPDSKEGETAP